MKTPLHIICAFVFGSILYQQNIMGQCSPADFQTVFIHPDSTIAASLIIENAVNNDLANPSQGVCGVKLNFSHNSIKELEVRLISPSGQSINLIGPISPDGSLIFNTSWDISFLRCSEIPSPDTGFSNPWTNTDPWAGFARYTGSYHPHQECLEDVFNTGPVNGLWSLEILNDARFDEGDLISFELEFCDDNFDCNQCFPTPGTFDGIGLPADYCIGDESLDFDFESLRLANDPDYDYQFYVLQDDDIIEVVDDPDLSTYDAGSYQICGLSFYSNQAAELVNDNSFEVLQNLYSSAQSPICASFTESCFVVNISPYTDTLMIDTTICLGDVFSYQGANYDIAGIYEGNVGIQQCDTLVMIDLKTVELSALISNDSDLLTCDNDRITLSANASTFTANTDIRWRTDDGSLTGDPNSNEVVATQAGRYWLVLTEGACQDSFFVDIEVDTDLPVLEITVSDTLDCNVNMVNLLVNSTPAATGYDWSGPQNNLEDNQNIVVNTPGLYTVDVTLPTGCTATISIEVRSDFAEPPLEITSSDISCTQTVGFAEITDLSREIIYTFEGGNLNFDGQIEYNATGAYTILAESADNGCTSDTTFNINSIVREPMLTFEPVDVISCGNTSVDLIVNADIDIASYSWEGPDGAIPETGNTINVDDGGEYIVTVIADNGCTNNISQAVTAENTDLPSLSISADTIRCNNTVAQITTITDQTGIDYEWTNLDGYRSTDQNPPVTAGGKYFLSAAVSDNCIVIDSIIVQEDLEPPVLETTALPITCDRPETALQIVDQIVDISYTWLDTDGNTLQGEIPNVSEAGSYILQGIGANGCPNTTTQLVTIDTIAPVAVASSPQVLLCERTQVNLSGDGSSEGQEFAYQWSTTEGSIISDVNSLEPLVGAIGNYILQVTNQNNGCTTEAITLLEESRSDITDFEFDKFDPPCADAPSGRILINNVSGGEGPYSYSVDGVNFQSDPNFEELSAEVYTVIVKDVFGCDVSKNVILESGLEVSVVLEDSYEINLGDQLELEPELNTNGDPLRSIEWQLDNQTLANGEERIIVNPLQSSTIEVSISTQSGCNSTATALIEVSKEKDIYAPNTISVSDFGENRTFKVYPSNAVQEIISIDIYDRWGSKVFGADRHDPRTDPKVWDGTHQSQNLSPGIYVYLIEVLLIDGERRVIPGEVLLVR